MAFGEIGLTPHDYYSMTMRDFILTVRGYFKRRAHEFEHTREIAYAIYATQFGRKKRMPPKQKWWPLPTDSHVLFEEEQMKETWDLLWNKN